MTELDWWNEVPITEDLKITFTPAQHLSARGLFDTNKSLFGSFIIQHAGRTVFFAGDTAYNDHFKQIASRFKSIDLALLPIGAYEPNWYMKQEHVNPEEAVLAHIDLNAKMSIPIHFGTFQNSTESFDDPPTKLKEALLRHHIAEAKFPIVSEGVTTPID